MTKQQKTPLELISMIMTGGIKKQCANQENNLKVIRSLPATHENIQKELRLLRDGDSTDIIVWLKRHKKDKVVSKLLDMDIHFLGYQNGARVFQPGFAYEYIFEKAGKIWTDIDFEIYDKGVNFANRITNQELQWLTNELGDKFAKQFVEECSGLSFYDAMVMYYKYLAKVYIRKTTKYKRICAACEDFRNKNKKHFLK